MAGCRTAWLWSANFALLVVMAHTVVSAQASSFVLKWSPEAHTDGLQAFEGVQDNIQKFDPEVKHIFVQGNSYRFDMPVTQLKHGKSESNQCQRNEAFGMVANQTGLRILKGESWRIRHKLFIPRSLQATTTSTHVMQLVSTLPTLTLSLRQHANHTPAAIELHVYNRSAGAVSPRVVASAPLAPLQEKWIESQITFTAVAGGAFQWLLRDAATNVVIGQGEGSGDFIQVGRVRPKWGIYRSMTNTTYMHNCFMLIRDLQAWKQE